MSFLSRQQKEDFYLNILSGRKNKERVGLYSKNLLENPRDVYLRQLMSLPKKIHLELKNLKRLEPLDPKYNY